MDCDRHGKRSAYHPYDDAIAATLSPKVKRAGLDENVKLLNFRYLRPQVHSTWTQSTFLLPKSSNCEALLSSNTNLRYHLFNAVCMYVPAVLRERRNVPKLMDGPKR